MNIWTFLLGQPAVEALGWTLLHFVWQGALIAAVFAAARVFLFRRSPNARYLAGCVAMVFLLAAPICTFFVVSNSNQVTTPSLVTGAETAAPAPATSLKASPPSVADAAAAKPTVTPALTSAVTPLFSRIGYIPAPLLDALKEALIDPNETVRNSAARALHSIESDT